MKLAIKTNFDFGKLASQIDTLVAQAVKDTSKGVAESAKKYIKSGQVTPDITPYTKKRRKARGNPTSPPLYEYGKLHNSIKPVDGGIEMNGYGLAHQKGMGRLPERKFIFPQITKEVVSKFINNMKKAMRK